MVVLLVDFEVSVVCEVEVFVLFDSFTAGAEVLPELGKHFAQMVSMAFLHNVSGNLTIFLCISSSQKDS